MTVPLNDADYAAIRARVLGEIVAGRRRRRFAVAFATAAILAFALWLQEPPKPTAQPVKPVTQWSAGVLTGVSSPPPPEAPPVRTPALHKENHRPVPSE